MIEFCCGSHGCEMSERDDAAIAYATRIRYDYAVDVKKRTGEYPELADQERVQSLAYERFIQGDTDQWDWADEQAWEIVNAIFEGSEFEPDRNDRIKVASILRKERK